MNAEMESAMFDSEELPRRSGGGGGDAVFPEDKPLRTGGEISSVPPARGKLV